jgi:hypothetical protein
VLFGLLFSTLVTISYLPVLLTIVLRSRITRLPSAAPPAAPRG